MMLTSLATFLSVKFVLLSLGSTLEIVMFAHWFFASVMTVR